MKLKDKVALVTGAGRGIGQTIALLIAREGAKVVINDINPVWAEEAVKRVKSFSPQALSIVADIRKLSETNLMVKKVMEKFGRIDILVNNAGLTDIKPAEEVTEEEWTKVVDTCLKASFFCSQTVAKEMIKQQIPGRIVNVASMAAHAGVPYQSPYCAAKAGIIGLTKVLSAEWARYQITVNAVSPGATRTEQFEESMAKMPPEMREERERRVPIGHLAETEDIAQAVLFLLSPESTYITGQNICVDGGMLALFSGYILPWKK